MSHQSTQILQAVKAALLNHTDAGARVSLSPVVSYRGRQLPAIAIWDPNEDVDEGSWQSSRSPRKLDHKMVVRVIAAFKFTPGEDISAYANDFKGQIEKCMHADPWFGSVCQDSMKRSASKSADEESDHFVLFLTVEYEFKYVIDAPEAVDSQATNDFNTANSKFNIGNAQATADQVTSTKDLNP